MSVFLGSETATIDLTTLHYSRAFARYQNGDRLGAIEDLERAANLFLDRGNSPAYRKLKTILHRINTPQETL